MASSSKHSILHMILLGLLGGMTGSVIGEIIAQILPEGWWTRILGAGIRLGITTPLKVDLDVIFFTFGFGVHLNLLGIAGIFLGILIYYRYL